MVSRKLAPPGGIQGTALEIFGGLASSYERALDLATMTQDRYWKCWVVENASIRAGDRVLDIGCGTCLLEERLEDTGCMVVGLDLTEQMIRIGQSKNLVCLEGLLVGDAEALPFPDGTFDAVVCCYVPKYVDRARFAREVARVLRAGGKVVSYRLRTACRPVLSATKAVPPRRHANHSILAGAGRERSSNNLPEPASDCRGSEME